MFQGHCDEALATEQRSLAIAVKRTGVDQPITASPLYQIGRIQRRRGHGDEAVASSQHAIAIWEKAVGADLINLAPALTDIGLVELSRQAPLWALPPLKRAQAIWQKHPSDGDPLDKAETRFALARALSDAGRSGDEAHGLAVQARTDCVAADPKAKRQLAEIDAWLAAHGK
jgi:hypothetical protein